MKCTTYNTELSSCSYVRTVVLLIVFLFNDTATTEIYTYEHTLSLHDALPISIRYLMETKDREGRPVDPVARFHLGNGARPEQLNWMADSSDRKSTRLNSSH